MFLPSDAILVTDDSANMRRLIIDSLEALGFLNIVSAVDVNEALRKLNDQLEKGDPVKLILTDLNMPGKSGIDFLKIVKTSAAFKELPVIMITTEGEQESVLDAAISGVSSYLIKPFEVQSLSKRIVEAWRTVDKK